MFIGIFNRTRDANPDRYRIFQVPAGRYALWKYFNAQSVADFCVRAPAFDLAAGDVVYAGYWTTSEAGPLSASQADAEEARSALGAISGQAATAMQLATFQNGARFPCNGTDIVTRLYGIDLQAVTPEAAPLETQ